MVEKNKEIDLIFKRFTAYAKNNIMPYIDYDTLLYKNFYHNKENTGYRKFLENNNIIIAHENTKTIIVDKDKKMEFKSGVW